MVFKTSYLKIPGPQHFCSMRGWWFSKPHTSKNLDLTVFAPCEVYGFQNLIPQNTWISAFLLHARSKVFHHSGWGTETSPPNDHSARLTVSAPHWLRNPNVSAKRPQCDICAQSGPKITKVRDMSWKVRTSILLHFQFQLAFYFIFQFQLAFYFVSSWSLLVSQNILCTYGVVRWWGTVCRSRHDAFQLAIL